MNSCYSLQPNDTNLYTVVRDIFFYSIFSRLPVLCNQHHCTLQPNDFYPPQVTDKLYYIMLYRAYLARAGFDLTTLVVIGTIAFSVDYLFCVINIIALYNPMISNLCTVVRIILEIFM
jgi:hypothetical protein